MQGNRIAQGHLGRALARGLGVLRDHVLGHMWLNIAGANGHESSLALRDALEERMTRDEIAEAETLARRCLTSHYEDCDRN